MKDDICYICDTHLCKTCQGCNCEDSYCNCEFDTILEKLEEFEDDLENKDLDDIDEDDDF